MMYYSHHNVKLCKLICPLPLQMLAIHEFPSEGCGGMSSSLMMMMVRFSGGAGTRRSADHRSATPGCRVRTPRTDRKTARTGGMDPKGSPPSDSRSASSGGRLAKCGAVGVFLVGPLNRCTHRGKNCVVGGHSPSFRLRYSKQPFGGVIPSTVSSKDRTQWL